MLSDVKQLIEDNIHLIEGNYWDIMYSRVRQKDPLLTPYFTEVMLEAGLNPLEYMTYVPDRYVMGRDNVTGKFVIPNGITRIGEEAFSTCYYLTDVIIPNSVKIIDGGAFSFCHGLKVMTIPDNVTTVGEFLFRGCNNLKGVILSSNLTTLPYFTFAYCSMLESVTLGPNLDKIEAHIFVDCERMHVLKYRGTQEQWNAIEKDHQWDQYSSIQQVQCADGVIDV